MKGLIRHKMRQGLDRDTAIAEVRDAGWCF